MADPAPASGPVAAADQIRQTAKWLTVSLASIAAVLVGGSQLSDLGALERGSDRMWIAVGALTLAAVMTGAILACNVWVATTPAHTLAFLAGSKRKPGAVQQLLQDPLFLGGLSDVAELKEAFEQAFEEQNAAYAAAAPPVVLTDQLLAKITDANVKVTGYQQTAAGLLSSVSYTWVAWRWQRAAWVLVGCGLLAAAGIALFAWAANPPANAKASTATPAQVDAPVAVSVMLTPAGQEALTKALGCDAARPLKGLKLADTPAGPDLVIVRQDDGTCSPTRFVAGVDWATVRT